MGAPILGHEQEIRFRDGTSRWIYGNTVPLFDEQGKVSQVVAAFVDVTDRRAAQEALRLSEERLRLMAEQVPAILWTTDSELIITSCLGAGLTGLGFKPGELVGRKLEAFVGEEDPAILAHRRAIDEGVPVRYEGVYGGRYFQSYVDPLRDARGIVVGLVGVGLDLTERKGAEDVMTRDLAVARRLNAVGEECSRPSGDFGQCLDVILAAAIELSGAQKGNIQLLDPQSSTLRIVSQQGFGEEFLKCFEKVEVGDSSACAGALASGKRVLVEDVEASPLFAGQPSLAVLQRAGVRAVQSTPLLSVGGKIIGIVSTHFSQPRRFDGLDLVWLDLLARQAADYIARRRAEEDIHALNTSLEERVRARTADLTQALRELETFSYTIAHDLRAPLRTMRGFSEILLGDYGSKLDDEGLDAAKRIVDGVKRMDALTNDLLAYGRVAQAAIVPEELDLDAVSNEVLRGMEAEIKASSVRVEIRRPLANVRASRSLLSQALGNLISNACKFVLPGRTPEIEIGTVRRGGRVELWVRDRGIGIEKHHQSKVFGMFERLEPGRFPGTGIGLAIVRKAAERMGGTAGLESEAGKGSRFWVELPATDGAP
jgi:PAS domain S-box-containing protein